MLDVLDMKEKSELQTNNSDQIGRKAIFGTFYTLIGDYLVYVINFIRGIILARLLLPEMFGILKMAEFFSGVFGQPNNIGFDQAVIQRQDKLTEAFNGHLLLNIITAGLGILIALIAGPILLKFYDPQVVWVLWVLMGILFIQAVSSTPGVYLRKNFYFDRLSIAQIIGSIVAFGISIYLAKLGFGVWALVSVFASMEAVKLILLWLFTPWQPSLKINWQINKQILIFGGTIWVAGLFSFIMLQFDDFLVGQFAGMIQLGFYAKAYSLAQQPLGLFSQVINKVAGPVIAELKDDREKLERTFNLILGLVYKGTIFIGMVLFIWAPQIVVLLIGEKWLPMIPMFRGLILYLVAQPIWDIVGSFLTFTGRPKIFAQGQALQAILLMVLGTVIVFQWGGIGAALTVSSILLTITIFYLWRYIGQSIWVNWKDGFVLPTLAIVLTGVISHWFIGSFLSPGLSFWFGVLLMPALVYLSLIILFQGQKVKNDVLFLHRVTFKKKL